MATLFAKLLGAGWGTASSFGQLAFVAALVSVLIWGDHPDGTNSSAVRRDR